VEAGRELTLAEALDSLREQLLDAVDRAQGAELALVCQGVEVELAVTVNTVFKGEGKVRRSTDSLSRGNGTASFPGHSCFVLSVPGLYSRYRPLPRSTHQKSR
jgi:hypothetical protein